MVSKTPVKPSVKQLITVISKTITEKKIRKKAV